MKKTLFAAFAVFALISSFYLTSCEEDPCAGVDFGVHGKCVDGVAVCDAGYEVDPGNGRCDVITSTKFTADYNIAEFDQAGKAIQVKDATGKLIDLKYASSIKAAVPADINKVTVVNLGDYRCFKNGKDVLVEIPATVKGDSLKFNYTDCNNTFVGFGHIKSNVITFFYSNTYPPDPAKPSTLITEKNKSVWTKK